MWLQLAIVTLLAALVQGVVGFGFTLVALFFYLLALPSTEAVQLVILMNLAITVVLVSRLWRQVVLRLWLTLVAGGMLGFPAGLWWFARADAGAIRLAVAVLTIAFAAAVLWRELLGGGYSAVERSIAMTAAPGGSSVDSPFAVAPAVPHRSASAMLVGTAAGALTASLGAPGPPIALYLAALGIDKTTFRALAPASLAVLLLGAVGGQAVYVGIDASVWRHALILVPAAIVGAAGGDLLSGYVSERWFRRCVLVLLLFAGAYMLYRASMS